MIYFDNAATTLKKPRSVLRAMNGYMKTKGGNPGRGAHFMSMRAANEIFYCREKISELLRAQPEEIILTPSATFALNLAIKGTLNSSDHAIINDISHNAALRPLNAVCAFDVCSSPEDAFYKIKPNTRMLVINHASNVTGEICDLEGYKKLAKDKSLLLLLDISQTAGHIPIDLNGVSIAACAGHKALLGPQGTGFLYVKKGMELKPLLHGGTGFESESLHQPSVLPDGLESGTLNGVGFSGLAAGVKYVMNKKDVKTDELNSYLKCELSRISWVELYSQIYKKTVPVVSFNINGKDCECIASVLSEKYKICVRSGLHCAPLAHKRTKTLETGAVRVSLCRFNTMAEIEKFLNIIDKRASFGV